MRLHEDKKLFSDLVRSTSDKLGISQVFIEKDYWITYILNNLAKSNYSKLTVFKGGTSLSKAYHLINRFSEDIDLTIINDEKLTGSQIKNLIRDIEKEITKGLTEKEIENLTSKGSRFRKSVYEYDSIERKSTTNWLILEINSFIAPFPIEKREIKSFISEFLEQSSNESYIQSYGLQAFDILVLNKCQTLVEKLSSLIRLSFDNDILVAMSEKIRHFYDLYFLVADSECSTFIHSEEFLIQFNKVLNHDREISNIPEGWQKKSISESPLINDFSNIWIKLKSRYKDELSQLAFSAIPDEKEIANSFNILISMLRKLI